MKASLALVPPPPLARKSSTWAEVAENAGWKTFLSPEPPSSDMSQEHRRHRNRKEAAMPPRRRGTIFMGITYLKTATPTAGDFPRRRPWTSWAPPAAFRAAKPRDLAGALMAEGRVPVQGMDTMVVAPDAMALPGS